MQQLTARFKSPADKGEAAEEPTSEEAVTEADVADSVVDAAAEMDRSSSKATATSVVPGATSPAIAQQEEAESKRHQQKSA